MDGYVRAWTSVDPDDIAELFTPDAVYDPQTGDGEWEGRDEIVARWIQGAEEDGPDWEFEWRPLVEADDVAVVTAHTRYLDPPASYRNLFVIRFDQSGRCRDFTEWWIEEEV